MNFRVACTLVLGVGLGATHAPAALIGSAVTGTLTTPGYSANYFAPANGIVPPSGFLNSGGSKVAISATAVEFGMATGSLKVSANFSASQLVIEKVSSLAGTMRPYTMTFTDGAFAGLVFTPVENTFGLAPTASLSGTTLTVSYPPEVVAANTVYRSVFSLTSSVPEPASLAGVAAAGAVGLARRRRTT